MKSSIISCKLPKITLPAIIPPKTPKNPLKTPYILMINTIPGGVFEHADD